MEKIEVNGMIFVPMFRHEEIVEIVKGVAAKLNEAYKDCKEKPLLLCTLNGALPFCGELMMHVNFDPEIASIKLSTYEGTESTGSIKKLIGPTTSVEGRNVIIVEDIVDTGISLRNLRRIMEEMGAKSAKVCTLLFKPGKFHAEEKKSGSMILPEFVGKEIPDAFILGYGLDYNDSFRCLRDIYVLKD